ncbi:hypothetical protein [Paenibacillus larvae]|uniref:hypothetical protein n=1 Tax=Paenibacillus larvae TaxID=1464 RepID=UPI0028923E00|nr:hypothetical protein [Paenibacillus larvae]MDT2193663.1 hypothetical protein [Paenibacillus larvae]
MHSYVRERWIGEPWQIKHSSGAPTRLTKQQQIRLKQTVAYSVPHEVGLTAKHNWTLN